MKRDMIGVSMRMFPTRWSLQLESINKGMSNMFYRDELLHLSIKLCILLCCLYHKELLIKTY